MKLLPFWCLISFRFCRILDFRLFHLDAKLLFALSAYLCYSYIYVCQASTLPLSRTRSLLTCIKHFFNKPAVLHRF